MVFLNPNDDESSSSSKQQQQTTTCPRHRNNLQKLWSKFSLKLSTACLGLGKKKTKNLALSASEIKRRMPGIPVHKVTDYGQRALTFNLTCGVDLELYYINKSDAQDFHLSPNILNPLLHTPCQVLDSPLSHVVNHFEECDSLIRLVPELSQVKNAIELLNKDGKEKVAEFDGVPVFQSDWLIFTDDDTGDTFSPAFFRKEDLENLIATKIKPEERDHIIYKVSAFEDIIRKMKDDSTSESNNTFFVGAGITSWTWFKL